MTRWKRFSLRTFFVLLTLFCIALGIHTARMRSAEKQREVVAKLLPAGGNAFYDFEIATNGIHSTLELRRDWDYESDHPAMKVWTVPSCPVPQWLVDRLGIDYFCTVEAVSIGKLIYSRGVYSPTGAIIGSDQTAHDVFPELARLPKLHTLALAVWRPDALQSLKHMPRLRHVAFISDVDERHLMHVAESRVEVVELPNNNTDEELVALAKSKHLRELRMSLDTDIVPSPFTDRGVAALCDLELLTSLCLKSDHVTISSAKEIARLRNLTELRLRLPRMSAGIRTAIAGKPLHTLHLLHMKIDDEAFAAIGELAELETLSLHGRPEPCYFHFSGQFAEREKDDHMAREYASLKAEFAHAHPASEKISPAGFEAICKLKKLKRLRLHSYELSGSQIKTLLQNVPLRFLLIAQDIPEADGKAIAAAFPKLELYFYKDEVPTPCSGTTSP